MKFLEIFFGFFQGKENIKGNVADFMYMLIHTQHIYIYIYNTWEKTVENFSDTFFYFHRNWLAWVTLKFPQTLKWVIFKVAD